MSSWRVRGEEGREYIWRKACQMSLTQPFTYHSLSAEVGLAPDTIRTICRAWEEAGKLVRVPSERKLVHLEVPRHLNDQAIRISVRPADTPQDRMWRVIRKLTSFDPRDVAMYANCPEIEVSEEAALEYCRVLFRSGYLRALRKAVPGQKPPIYQLIRNTGPRAPREKRIRAVWDENLGKITHLPEGMPT